MVYDGTRGYFVGKAYSKITTLIIYVDVSNGSDELTDGRGFTPQKAFKSITAAYDFLHSSISASGYNTVTIHLAPGHYKFTRAAFHGFSTNQIVIDGNNNSGEVSLEGAGDGEKNTSDYIQNTNVFRNGYFHFRNINFKCSGAVSFCVDGSNTIGIMQNCTITCYTSNGKHVPTPLHIGYGAYLRIWNPLTFDVSGLTENEYLTNNKFWVLMMCGWQGKIHIGNTPIQIKLPENFSNNQLYLVDASDGGQFYIVNGQKIKISGIDSNMQCACCNRAGMIVCSDGNVVRSDNNTLTSVTFEQMFGKECSADTDAISTFSMMNTNEFQSMYDEIDAEYRRVGILK